MGRYDIWATFGQVSYESVSQEQFHIVTKRWEGGRCEEEGEGEEEEERKVYSRLTQ